MPIDLLITSILALVTDPTCTSCILAKSPLIVLLLLYLGVLRKYRLCLLNSAVFNILVPKSEGLSAVFTLIALHMVLFRISITHPCLRSMNFIPVGSSKFGHQERRRKVLERCRVLLTGLAADLETKQA